ncbi:hypothetical protein D0B54_17965 [Solimonas sp. K1W22B-7]|uniref:hypothetical protein n=1 Tax=Solimonas sp. K1W22B-7 TaxID=2303331 RepID=UPI000E337A91|nr:hypothetical protein [Solimonas sp. K1W22B-7]AXQ30447.1 hypothetical protein D0B54_17965 [Solimonas sp. K1W22B-7]
MTRIRIEPSRGLIPRVAPQLLPPECAQVATNARLLSGDLEAWRQPAQIAALFKSGEIRSLHLMARQHWLHWTAAELGAGAVTVDVARGPIAGDETERTYFTGTDAPRVTDIARAIGACGGAYPCDSLLLGVPAPEAAPQLSLDGALPEASNVELLNPGAESAGTAGWIVDAGDLGVHAAGDVADLAPQAGGYFFHGGSVAETRAHQTLPMDLVGLVAGQGLSLSWWQASGAHAGQAGMSLLFLDEGDTEIGRVDAAPEASSPALQWRQRTISGQIPADAAQVRLELRCLRAGADINDGYIDSITLASQDYSQSFDGSTLSGWTTSPNDGNGNSFRRLTVDSSQGQPAPCIRYDGDSRHAFMYRNFSTQQSPRVRLQYEARAHPKSAIAALVMATSAGSAYGLRLNPGGSVSWNAMNSWTDSGTLVETVLTSAGAYAGNWLQFEIDIEMRDRNRAMASVTVRDKASGSVLADAVQTEIGVAGPYSGFNFYGNFHGRYVWLDNIGLTVVAPEPEQPDATVFVSYVQTFCNEYGEEGPPGPHSRSAQRNSNAPVTIATPVAAPPGYGITHKVLYRSATGASGTAYQFLAKIPLAQESYVDLQADTDLGGVLESQLHDLPPADLRGLLAMPNRFLAGFSKNELLLSAQGRYHAFPLDYRLATDYPIVAIGAIDASVVVLTESHPYVATGYTPDAMSMRKLEVPYACSARRSVANLKDFGIVYSSPDGLVAINGQGAPLLLTEALMTREQWQALNPASILGVAHDDRYFGFYEKSGGERGGFILDARANGFGLVFIDLWAQAAFSDALSDRLLLVIDDAVWQWEGGSTRRPYTWRSRLFQLPRPTAFACAQVRAADYEDLVLTLLADGQPYFSRAITSVTEFVLPDRVAQAGFEVELSGTSRVQSVELAEEMEELG